MLVRTHHDGDGLVDPPDIDFGVITSSQVNEAGTMAQSNAVDLALMGHKLV